MQEAFAEFLNDASLDYEKHLLTLDETAVYFHIGSDRMRSLIKNNPEAKWFIKVGARKMIKKDMFALWLDEQREI